MSKICAICICLILLLCATNSTLMAQDPITPQQYQEDFEYLCKEIQDSYAYFDKKQTDWSRVPEIYRPMLKNVKNEREFIGLLESVMAELYDFHATLGVNTALSPNLVPTGADLWAKWNPTNDKAIITEVRAHSVAEQAGLKVGMQVISVDGIPVDKAIYKYIGKSLNTVDQTIKNWALLALLAGNHTGVRTLEVKDKEQLKKFSLSQQPPNQANSSLLEYKRLEKGIGYIRFNNSLGNNSLIKEFDLALGELKDTKGLILDLRNTPSGGNSTVARAIMSRFISQEMPYQKHSVPAEERMFGVRRSWLEIVSPRGEFIYKSPVIVLVDHWTGSMGEGIAIGMDGLKRVTVVGTEMAGLAGAVDDISLPNTKFVVKFPMEKLFHINGTPREDFVPPVFVDLLSQDNQNSVDPILTVGLKTVVSLEH